MSLLPEIYNSEAIQERDWTESSLFAVLWNSVEDRLLEEMHAFVKQKPFRHLSLHYDDIVVDPGRTSMESDFGDACSAAVKHATGFEVRFRRKVHYTFMKVFQRNRQIAYYMSSCLPCCQVCSEYRERFLP
jgi:hypothetical protein